MKQLVKVFILSLILSLGLPMAAFARDVSPSFDGALAQEANNCPIDIVFVLDGSGSINRNDFDHVMKPWLLGLIDRFEVGPNNARVGVIQFSGVAQLQQSLSSNADAIRNSINGMRQFGGGTATEEGLRLALYELNNNGRADAPRVIIVLTDGNSNNQGSTIRAANNIRAEQRAARTVILGVAVGSINLGEIIAIAGSEDNVINVPDFDGLMQTLSILRDYSCAIAVDGTTELSLNLPTSQPQAVVVPPAQPQATQAPAQQSQAPAQATQAPAQQSQAQATQAPAQQAQPAQATPVPVQATPIPPTATPEPAIEVALAAQLSQHMNADLLNGSILAFSSNRGGNPEIYTMNPDGSNLRAITNNGRINDKPDISPDGRLIAWESNANGNFEIWVANIDGSNPRNVTNHPADDYGPSWSPDGSKIAFHSTREGSSDIYIMNADGSSPLRITQNPNAIDRSASWSPDSTKLVYFGERVEGRREIYVMDIFTLQETRLTENEVYDGHPQWSPDGALIVYGSTRSLTDTRSDICIMNADGSGAYCLPTPIGTDDAPQWSPDGEWIAFESGAAGNFDIWLIKTDGSILFQLTTDPARDWSVTWGVKP